MNKNELITRFGLTLILFILIPDFISGASVEQLNRRFTNYFLSGDISAWKALVDSLRLHRLGADKEKVLLYAEYGLVGNYVGARRNDEARVELGFFENRVSEALRRRPNDADLHAFAAASVAFKIALSPWRAPFLSRSHNENVQRAVQLGPALGLPLTEQANSLYFRPAIVGGNKSEALKHYEGAYRYYKAQMPDHWMCYNVGAWLGQVYANQGMAAKAEAIYLELLQKAPDFKWVKDELLPDVRAGKVPENAFFEGIE